MKGLYERQFVSVELQMEERQVVEAQAYVFTGDRSLITTDDWDFTQFQTLEFIKAENI